MHGCLHGFKKIPSNLWVVWVGYISFQEISYAGKPQVLSSNILSNLWVEWLRYVSSHFSQLHSGAASGNKTIFYCIDGHTSLKTVFTPHSERNLKKNMLEILKALTIDKLIHFMHLFGLNIWKIIFKIIPSNPHENYSLV
jgi:hypothetical protein